MDDKKTHIANYQYIHINVSHKSASYHNPNCIIISSLPNSMRGHIMVLRWCANAADPRIAARESERHATHSHLIPLSQLSQSSWSSLLSSLLS